MDFDDHAVSTDLVSLGAMSIGTPNAGGLVNGVCKFTVPHDQSGRPAVDDGPAAGYTVYSR